MLADFLTIYTYKQALLSHIDKICKDRSIPCQKYSIDYLSSTYTPKRRETIEMGRKPEGE